MSGSSQALVCIHEARWCYKHPKFYTYRSSPLLPRVAASDASGSRYERRKARREAAIEVLESAWATGDLDALRAAVRRGESVSRAAD